MEISAVISAYNPDLAVLRRTIEALLAQEFPPEQYEIIVADDGSTNGAAEMVRTIHGRAAVRHVAQPHRGLSAARNLGAREARGRVVLFVDADFTRISGPLPRCSPHTAGTTRRAPAESRCRGSH